MPDPSLAAGPDREAFDHLHDGPTHFGHMLGLLPRVLLFAGPFLGIGLAITAASLLDGSSLGSALEPTLLCGGVAGFVVLIVVMAQPANALQQRRRRDLYLARGRKGDRLVWSATLIQQSVPMVGSLHVCGGLLRFLWHRGVNTMDGRIALEQEESIRCEVGQVAAVELVSPETFWEARFGVRQVALLLKDGQRIRVAAPQPKRLVHALQVVLAKPAGTPVAPELQTALEQASLAELSAALTRRCEQVVVIAGEREAAPHVVLEGEREGLLESLELARLALEVERHELGPYRAARAGREPEG